MPFFPPDAPLPVPPPPMKLKRLARSLPPRGLSDTLRCGCSLAGGEEAFGVGAVEVDGAVESVGWIRGVPPTPPGPRGRERMRISDEAIVDGCCWWPSRGARILPTGLFEAARERALSEAATS